MFEGSKRAAEEFPNNFDGELYVTGAQLLEVDHFGNTVVQPLHR